MYIKFDNLGSTWFQGTSWSPSATGDFVTHTDNPKRRAAELEKKLYNLSKVVRAYRNEKDIRRVELVLHVVSQARRLYPNPGMAVIPGIDAYIVRHETFDAKLLMRQILFHAQKDYQELQRKYTLLVDSDARDGEGQRKPGTARYSENIQRERYLRKRAAGAAYARDRVRPESGSSAFPLDQLPRGVARLVASKLQNTNLASYATTSKYARNEANGLLSGRLKIYKDFMSGLVDDILHYNKIWLSRAAVTERNGWKLTERYRNAALLKTNSQPPAKLKMRVMLGVGVEVIVRDSNSKAIFAVRYFSRTNSLEWRRLAGSETSDFMRRSYEALRQVAAAKQIALSMYQPLTPAPDRLPSDIRGF
jgi:hypothetical protein